jgi:hypothetical protein
MTFRIGERVTVAEDCLAYEAGSMHRLPLKAGEVVTVTRVDDSWMAVQRDQRVSFDLGLTHHQARTLLRKA